MSFKTRKVSPQNTKGLGESPADEVSDGGRVADESFHKDESYNEHSHFATRAVEDESSVTVRRRHQSLAMWTNALSNANRASIEQRYVTVGKVHGLGRQKKKAAKIFVALGTLSLAIVVVHIKLRHEDQAAANDDDDSGGTALAVYDALRSVEVLLTLAIIILTAIYYRAHHHILVLIGSRRIRANHLHAAFELCLLLLGVLPPGIETTVPIQRRRGANEYCYENGDLEISRHIDCYCLLQLVRIYQLGKWITFYLVLEHVKSPSVLGWQHSMSVHYSFRFKYIITKYPLKVIGALLLITWAIGSFVLHIIEPLYAASIWDAMYDTWILLLDAPPRTPCSIPGQLTVMCASFLGALCVAAVTAALTSAAELAPEEAQLVRKLETLEEVRKRERCALKFMQATVRVWLALRSQRRARILGAASQRAAASAEMVARYRREASDAAKDFHAASRHVVHLTHVHTLGVLHEGIEGMKSDQQKLVGKVDTLVRVLAETTRGLKALQMRLDQPANGLTEVSSPRRLAPIN